MTLYDFVWLSKTLYEYLWLCMTFKTIYDYMWLLRLYMTMKDFAWQYVSFYESFGFSMSLYDSVLHCMTLNDCIVYNPSLRCMTVDCFAVWLCDSLLGIIV